MTKQENKISIILPVFNGKPYIENAIESVKAQSYSNWELVISDNCSTDGTFEYCLKLASEDPRIKVEQNATNIGPALNFNRCIERSTGEYIELFGHDDWFEPKCLERLAAVLDNMPNVVAVTSSRNWVDADGKTFQINRKFSESRLIPSDEAIRSNIQTLDNWISAPVMYRSKFKGNGFNTNIVLYADLDYWCEMFKHGDLYYVDELLFNYRIHDQSGTSKMMRDLIFALDLMRMSDRYLDYFRQNDETNEQCLERLAKKMIEWADFCLYTRNYSYQHLLGPAPVDVSVFPLPPLERAEADVHDYRRALAITLAQAAKERREFLAERTKLHQQLSEQHSNNNARISESNARIAELESKIQELQESSSWRLTAPLRKTMDLLRRS